MVAPSREGRRAVQVPGHWRCDEKPPAEIFIGSCFLLLPDICGGRQPSCGHSSQTAPGHHQEAVTAGDLPRNLREKNGTKCHHFNPRNTAAFFLFWLCEL